MKFISPKSKILNITSIITIIFFASIMFSFASHDVSASKSGHLTLLAVSEIDGDMQGSIVDIYLEIIPGKGRVFLDTFPLTKLDTQMSTRFAKEIACNYYDTDCQNLDFIYTIRGRSTIVGGPSAGSAIAVLTASLLLDKPIDESVAITGTINSGGVIGSVSGIKSKIDAASDNNITTVLIPFGTKYSSGVSAIEKFNMTLEMLNITDDNSSIIDDSSSHNLTNLTSDIFGENFSFEKYGEQRGVKVIEVFTLDDAMKEFTGYSINGMQKKIIINDAYNRTMRYVSEGLCNRTRKLLSNVEYAIENIDNENIDLQYNITTGSLVNNTDYSVAKNFYNRSLSATNTSQFYSAASFCFGANVRLSTLISNVTSTNTSSGSSELSEKVNDFEKSFNSKTLSTKTDLETFIVVNERIQETFEIIDNINTSDDYAAYGYAKERFYSAISWSMFFGTGSKELVLDRTSLRESCTLKIREAEERYQYSNLILPGIFENVKLDIENAYDELRKGKYDLCLFKASKAKAQANVFLGTLGSEEDEVSELIEVKQQVAQNAIANQIEKGNFPILGYSYFEYSKSLKPYELYSSLLYSEYALELSDLDMYFKAPESHKNLIVDKTKLAIFFFGLFTGIIVSIIYVSGRKRIKPKKENQ